MAASPSKALVARLGCVLALVAVPAAADNANDDVTIAAIGTGCVATRAIDRVAMGMDWSKNHAWNATYTCDGDLSFTDGIGRICWEKHTTFDSGDVAWMLFATTFVMLQTPAAGFAQGGLVRRKNALSVIGQSFMGVVIGCIIWYTIGYSLTFGDSVGGLIGNPTTHFFFNGVRSDGCSSAAPTIPHTLYASFQMSFALMVPCLVTGAWAEKFHFVGAMLFMAIWPFLVYYPIAHWIWGGGWLQQQGVLDFAGGITIHLTSGVASFVVVLMLQKRRVFQKGKVDDTTHNVPLSLIGAALIWVGWYSFNGGSALRANSQAASALLSTQISACVGAASWGVLSKLDDGYYQISDLISGALAGLAGVTACSGFVEHHTASLIGLLNGVASFYSGKLIKSRINMDDVLDVVTLQGVPGLVGSLLVGLLASKDVVPCPPPFHHFRPCNKTGLGGIGLFYGGGGRLLLWQFIAVAVAIVWTAVMTWVTLKIIQAVAFLDVPPEYEELGLDKSDHGEKAYDIEHDADELEEEIMAAKLCDAAVEGNVAACRKLLRKGLDPLAADVDGRTALHLAAAAGNVEVLRLLIEEFGASVDATDNWGSTCLRDAIAFKHFECIAWLKAHGATLVAKATDVAALLHAADDGDAATVVAMATAGVDVDAKDYDGRGALHLAACAGHVEVCKVLLARGACPTATDRWGSRPVDDALRYRHEDVVAVFNECAQPGAALSFRASVDSITSGGGGGGGNGARASGMSSKSNTSTVELLAAARAGDLAEVKRLHKKRVDLMLADYDGRTAFHVAAAAGHLDVIRYIATQKAANLNVQDNMHQTPLQDAINASHHGVVGWLKDHGAVVMDKMLGARLCQAAFDGNTAELKKTRLAGVDVNTADYDGRTAMHLAAAAGRADTIKLLLGMGGRVNVKDRWGSTPLTDATKQNQHAVVDVLLQASSSSLQVHDDPMAINTIQWTGSTATGGSKGKGKGKGKGEGKGRGGGGLGAHAGIGSVQRAGVGGGQTGDDSDGDDVALLGSSPGQQQGTARSHYDN